MNPERPKAVEKFISKNEGRFQFEDSVISGINKYPELLKNSEFRDVAFQAALTKHRLLLLKSGLTYGEVFEQSNKVQEAIAQRNGKKQFIENMQRAWGEEIPEHPTLKPGESLTHLTNEPLSSNEVSSSPILLDIEDIWIENGNEFTDNNFISMNEGVTYELVSQTEISAEVTSLRA